MEERKVTLTRKTKETDIALSLNLDGNGTNKIDTGIGFFNHMLELLSVHSGIDMEVKCKGDIDVDFHHSVEDIGIVFGNALNKALGDKVGIERYADKVIPMDETVVLCAVDLGGRNAFVYDIDLTGTIGDFDAELVKEFFKAVTDNAKINIFFKEFTKCDNKHHKAEAIFKAFARCLKDAVKITSNRLLSSKGTLW